MLKCCSCKLGKTQLLMIKNNSFILLFSLYNNAVLLCAFM